MSSSVIRILVLLAGVGVVAAATHANVNHAGGYSSGDAPLIIAVAVLLSLGMAFTAASFREGRRLQAILLGICLISGEAYWVLVNADREISARDVAAAPARDAADKRSHAKKRLESAELSKAMTDAAAITEAAKPGCRANCAKLLLEAQERADRELSAARDALAQTPEPLAASPLSDRIGIPAWAWDLVLAGLRSLAIVGGSIAIGMVLHQRPRDEKFVGSTKPPTSVDVEILPPFDSREHVSRFLKSVLQPDPNGSASLRTLHGRYLEWSGDRPALPPAELGRELRSVIRAIGLKCERQGQDIIVHGAMVRE